MSSSLDRKSRAGALAASLLAASLLVALAAALAAAPSLSRVQEDGAMTKKSVESVLDAHSPALMAHPEVVGTGVGLCNGSPCIKVFVTARSAELQRRIGAEIDGYRVDLVETGPIRALEPE